jgi:pimeloyl-ACP methyl ester carboxylesterase
MAERELYAKSSWTIRQVEIGEGLVFDVAERGDPRGRPVLLLHGFPQTHRAFDTVAVHLAAHGRRLLAPDQRGYSPGARPADVAAYATGNLVDDAARILDAYGIESADVVGHDWGTVVGWSLAAARPERVRTLTAVSVPHPRAMADALRDPSSGQRELSSYIQLFRQPGKAEEVLLADGAKRLRTAYEPLPDAAAEPHVQALSDPATLTAALNWYRAMRSDDSAKLPEVTVPTTYVWSTGDVAIGRSAAARCAQYATGPYRFVELDGVSHWIPDQAPDALADAVLHRLTHLG